LNQESNWPSARQDLEKVEKIKLIAYRLWLARRDRNISGDPTCDYYQAERIFDSYKNLKLLLLGSFGFSAMAFVLGRSPEEHYVQAMNAVIEFLEIADEHQLSLEPGQKFLQSDMLQLMADRCSRGEPHRRL
jgi:hypothetical protein